MTRRAAFREADVARAIRAALKAGLKAGEFAVQTHGDEVTILTHPANAALPSPELTDSDFEARLRTWRRSA